MVYIRAKKVKGDQYLYLVKSIWDSKKNTSKQEIVKYLGKSDKVVKDDIPIEYREDPKILSALSSHNPEDIKKREEIVDKSRKNLYKKLTDGDIHSSLKLYEDFIKIFSIADFFDRILKPVMYKIGDDWATNKISIATEHVASNVAQTLVKIIMDRENTIKAKKKIMICVPIGEEHHLGCDVIQTYLTSKGYKVFNMRTSMPTESLLNFIENNKPDIIMISITLDDNLKAGQRLVKKINENYKIPIIVGGYAFTNKKMPKIDADVFKDSSLDELPKIIRTAIS
ncbi:MAG: cobalamin-dependent protein [Nitrosopumilaceae archaeon]|nr:cobalamin-dependent protein [Nitrosopumilaceae archaeon]